MLDFIKIYENDEKNLDFFLQMYNIEPQENKVEQAKKLFEQLQLKSDSLYPYSVIDLYISSHIKDEKNILYSKTQIDNLSEEDRKKFADVLYLDETAVNFTERLIRILKYSNKLTTDFNKDLKNDLSWEILSKDFSEPLPIEIDDILNIPELNLTSKIIKISSEEILTEDGILLKFLDEKWIVDLNSIENLNLQVFSDINLLYKFPVKELINLCSANYQMRSICTQNNFWLHYFFLKYPKMVYSAHYDIFDNQIWKMLSLIFDMETPNFEPLFNYIFNRDDINLYQNIIKFLEQYELFMEVNFDNFLRYEVSPKFPSKIGELLYKKHENSIIYFLINNDIDSLRSLIQTKKLNLNEIYFDVDMNLLDFAIYNQNIPMTKMLLQNGGDLRKSIRSPTEIPIKKNNPELFETLLKYSKNFRKFLNHSSNLAGLLSSIGTPEMFRLALNYGLNPNNEYVQGNLYELVLKSSNPNKSEILKILE